MSTIQLKHGQLNYIEAGSGTPLILVHGYCGDHRYWDQVKPLLSAHYRVITPDLRGHGASSAKVGIYSMEELAEDLHQLITELGLEQVFILGHSLGGYATLAFAERYSEKLAGFGLIHSTSYPDTDAAKNNRDKAAAALRDQGIKPFIDDLAPKLFAPPHREQMANQVQFVQEIGLGTSLEGAIGCALGMRDRPDRTYVLAESTLPILLLAGEQDEVVPPERRFPVDKDNVLQLTLSRAGHMGMLECPKDFANAIQTYMQFAEGAREHV